MQAHWLGGAWRLGWFDPGAGVKVGAHKSDFNDGGWLEATVPGEVHMDLTRAGVTRGQMFDKPPEEELWAEKCEWWYRLAFVPDTKLKAGHVELVFDGLDTLATVYLNGKAVARSENMHAPVRVDVKDRLEWGKRNALAVRLDPVVDLAKGKSLRNLYTTTCAERLFVRKTQVSFGWDFHGRMITAGIWRPVRLECWDAARIEDVHVIAEPTEGGGGKFRIRAETRGKGGTVEAAVRPAGAARWSVTKKLPNGKGTIELKKAKLWWPYPCGKPNLYEVRVRLLGRGGKVIDERTCRTGVRKIELVQDPIEDGRRFAFRINGRDTYIRGANWVPATVHLADNSKRRYRELLERAVEGNVGMLRVWGGGIYEEDSFYEVADELGILIWQDFMWSCGVYPDGPKELKLARDEAVYQVKRLRNHPCIAIWCGDNECDWAFDWGRMTHAQRLAHGIQRKVLPQTCRRLDPTRSYIPSSPFSPTDTDPNASHEGDQHQYRWGSFDRGSDSHYSRFFEDRSRFVSEFGRGSPPSVETLSRYNYNRAEMDLRRRGRGGQPPPNAPDGQYGLVSGMQFTHGQFQKRVLEHYRRLWPTCGGTLHWKFNDPFSANGLGFGTMASVDPAGVPKLSYYYAKRAYAPVSASLKDEGDDKYSVWVCNGTDKAFEGEIRIDLHHQDNTRRDVLTERVRVEADASAPVAEFSLKQLGFSRWEDYRDNVAALRLLRRGREGHPAAREGGGDPEVYFDTHWFMDVAREVRLRLIWGKVTARLKKRSADELIIELKADRYVRPVELLVPGVSPSYDDNFIDLLAGVPRTVTIRPGPCERTDLTNRLLVVRGWNFKPIAVKT